MAFNKIETPGIPSGDERQQLEQMFRYLSRLAEDLNIQLEGIGGNELTDDERKVMMEIVRKDAEEKAPGSELERASYEMESLKSLIIKKAKFVQTSLQEYRMNLLRETVAEGQFGKYVRHTGLDVEVTPEGITQNYSFEEVVQGLKTYEVNAKNYIKTGLLRTVSSIPVYGVAIGKDVVTFSEDGTETYNDGNKVAELTADELSFWQSGNKIASYTGSEISFYSGNSKRVTIDSNGVTFLNGTTKLAELLSTALKFYYSGTLRTQMDTDGVKIYDGSTLLAKFTGSRLSFYNGGTEIMYISSGKIYATDDMEISSGKKITIGNWTFDQDGMFGAISSANEFSIGSKALTANVFGTQMISDGMNGLMMKIRYRPLAAPSTPLEDGIMKFKYDANASAQWSGSSGAAAKYLYMLGENYVGGPQDTDVLDGVFCKDGYYQNLYPYPGFSYYEGGIVIPFDYGDIGTDERRWNRAYIKTVNCTTLNQSSSRDVKHDIEDMEDVGEKLDRLRPVTFVYNGDPEERKRHGLIYEEALPVMPEICTRKDGGKAVSYLELVPMLLKEVQQLRARVAKLEGGE